MGQRSKNSPPSNNWTLFSDPAPERNWRTRGKGMGSGRGANTMKPTHFAQNPEKKMAIPKCIHCGKPAQPTPFDTPEMPHDYCGKCFAEWLVGKTNHGGGGSSKCQKASDKYECIGCGELIRTGEKYWYIPKSYECPERFHVCTDCYACP